MKITLVIPTYNEAENLPILAERLFSQNVQDLKILIVDDQSPDGCGEVADRLHEQYGEKFEVIHRKNREGLGKAYIQGIEYALSQGAEVVGMMDADLSHPPERLPEMLKALERVDIVIGSRYVEGGSLDDDWPLWRKALSRFANRYTRTILRLPIKDTTGGYRVWRREALEAIPFTETKSSGYVFIVELAYLATLAGFKFAEVPIKFSERQFGESKMSFRVQFEAAMRVWQLRRIYRNKVVKSKK
ncbi:MAG: polyprenol monophosphomannose synthase [Anaerolineaceae bacterium]|nr:polyprenol monophosphomannose synthase [Anaerolineaceae bacterium]